MVDENKNKRIRRVRKWGDQLVIPVNVFDQRDLGIEKDDEVDIADIYVIKNTKKQKKESKK